MDFCQWHDSTQQQQQHVLWVFWVGGPRDAREPCPLQRNRFGGALDPHPALHAVVPRSHRRDGVQLSREVQHYFVRELFVHAFSNAGSFQGVAFESTFHFALGFGGEQHQRKLKLRAKFLAFESPCAIKPKLKPKPERASFSASSVDVAPSFFAYPSYVYNVITFAFPKLLVHDQPTRRTAYF